MHLTSRQGSIEQIQDLDAAELIAWSLDNFDRKKIVLSTGFGMEGCALIDMAARQSAAPNVYYLDTGFFFKETYQLIDELKERYANVTFIDSGILFWLKLIGKYISRPIASSGELYPSFFNEVSVKITTVESRILSLEKFLPAIRSN